MAELEFPEVQYSPWTDQYGQVWAWNGVAWVRKARPPGITEAPIDSQQYARQDAAWELVSADEWYLGAKAISPERDNFDNPLIEGHTYYNTTDHTMYVWDTFEWDAFSGVSEIATLWEYRWDSEGMQPANYVLDVKAGDDHNNVPFDAWVRGLIIVTLYLDGIRLIEKRMLTPDYEGLPGRPSDEEFRLDYANEVSFPTIGNVANTYYAIDTGETFTTDGANPSIYTLGGQELEQYDYEVDYENQTVTLYAGLPLGTETVVIETGTLAASQYIKSTNTNASEWDFVSDDYDAPYPEKLPTQGSTKSYIDASDTILQAKIDAVLNSLVGSCFDFAGPVEPANSILCDNRELTQITYPKLYAAIGNTWNNWNGATTGTGMFRVPPSEINGNPIHYAGTQGGYPVGTYLKSQNKSHNHTNTHNHSGSTNAVGDHTHKQLLHNSSVYKKSYLEIGALQQDEPFNWDGSKTAPAGAHNHTITLNSASITTSNNGGIVSRPETAIVLKCIWVDIIV